MQNMTLYFKILGAVLWVYYACHTNTKLIKNGRQAAIFVLHICKICQVLSLSNTRQNNFFQMF